MIVFWDGRGTTINNTTYENTYAWFMQIRDGKIIDGTAFHDSITFNELWAQVTPARPLSQVTRLAQRRQYNPTPRREVVILFAEGSVSDAPSAIGRGPGAQARRTMLPGI